MCADFVFDSREREEFCGRYATRSKVLYVNIPRTTFFARLTHFCLRNVFEICGSIKLERALEAKDSSEIRLREN